MLNFYDFIQVYIFTTNHHLTWTTNLSASPEKHACHECENGLPSLRCVARSISSKENITV